MTRMPLALLTAVLAISCARVSAAQDARRKIKPPEMMRGHLTAFLSSITQQCVARHAAYRVH